MKAKNSVKNNPIGVRLLTAFVFILLAGLLKAQKGADIKMIYVSPVDNGYPILITYSSSGDFESFYLKDRVWQANTYMPKPNISIAKNNLKMIYVPATKDGYAILIVYSLTGDFESFYLKDKLWQANEYMPPPKISIAKVNLEMTFVAAVDNGYPILIVNSSSGNFESFYLKDKLWIPNTYMPKPPLTIAK